MSAAEVQEPRARADEEPSAEHDGNTGKRAREIREENEYVRTAFLERVAHELRGPAGVIQGALQELETALGADAEKYSQLLAIARRGVRRIVRSADRLQQTGQLERGNVQLHRESCDISVLVQNAVTEAQGLENRRSIEMDVQVGDAAVLAAVDARWLSVAVFELTSNAIRHATQRVQVKLTADEREIVISVTDDNRAHVDFAPARWKFTREARGLGLALAIVREVAEEHGGTLEIGCRDRSGLTTGSEVCLRLPREAQAEGGEARRLRS